MKNVLINATILVASVISIYLYFFHYLTKEFIDKNGDIITLGRKATFIDSLILLALVLIALLALIFLIRSLTFHFRK